MRLAACLEYDGSRFCGWQKQANAITVQETVERALSRIADEPVTASAAGRTDSGVHAGAQVIHFDTHSKRSLHSWLRGANTQLPEGVALQWVVPVPGHFHARFSATGRCYRYVILNRAVRPTYLAGRVGWDYRLLDTRRMRRAARYLIGRHDFSAFRASSCQSASAVRELRTLTVHRRGQWVWIDAQANAFLHHMVRNLVGVLCAVGAGEADPGWAREVLESRERQRGGVTAPAEGLYLTRVDYAADFSLPPAPPPCRYW